MDIDQKLVELLEFNIERYEIVYRVHATQRMFERNIDESEVLKVVKNGIIIEVYKSDKPFPSCLINGKSEKNRPIHVVTALDEENKRIYIVTTYDPSPEKWSEGYSKRIKI